MSDSGRTLGHCRHGFGPDRCHPCLSEERDSLLDTLNQVLAERDKFADRVDQLEEAARPFASVNIPENWPGECVLTWRGRSDDGTGRIGAYISYLCVEDQGGPTIADYRKLAVLVPE